VYTPGNWSRATQTVDVFSDEPRRCVAREAVALGRTLQRTEAAVIEVQIAALKDANDSLTAELHRLEEERDQLRSNRDYWRQAAETMKRQLGLFGGREITAHAI
jgi:ribosomal 50S subunit-associated protein YjgA (DUF615 family)